MDVLGLGRTLIWRARAAYLEKGLENPLFEEVRPGKPRQYDTEVVAKITAPGPFLSTGGRKALDHTIAGANGTHTGQAEIGIISRESIRRLQKKLPQAVAQAVLVRRYPDRGIPTADVRPTRPLRLSFPGEGTSRLPEREKQAVAQGLACALANGARNVRETRLRVCPRRHLQHIYGGRTQRVTTDRSCDRSPSQDGLCRLHPALD